MIVDQKTLEFYERHGKTPPERIPHDVNLEDLADKLQKVKINSWRMEGNMLIADTDIGEVANPIPTNYLLIGTDKNNLPKFKKL